MWQAGILSRRSEGTCAYYRVEDEMIFELCNRVCDRLATRLEQQARSFRVLNTKRLSHLSASVSCQLLFVNESALH